MARQVFDNGIIKIDKDGNEVFSTYLEDGEELAHGSKAPAARTTDEPTDDAATADRDESEKATDAVTGLENGGDQNLGSEPDAPVTGSAGPSPFVQETGEHGSNPEDDSEEDDSEEDSDESDDDSGESTETVERPKDTDNKDAWLVYAQSKGYTGTKDDLTARQFIEQYG